jgi:hypothetical protein
MNDAWAVVVAAVIGALSAQGGILITEWARDYRSTRLDRSRIALLKKMLTDSRFEWRKLSTLAHVIGVDEENARRLLIECGARASEDGGDLWGLVSRHPFPSTE